jgi:hypothetical protein
MVSRNDDSKNICVRGSPEIPILDVVDEKKKKKKKIRKHMTVKTGK